LEYALGFVDLRDEVYFDFVAYYQIYELASLVLRFVRVLLDHSFPQMIYLIFLR